jgi:hypothetical protein
MPTYLEELESEKKFQGNVVVRFLGEYFATREPDSGLTIRDKYKNVLAGVVNNPATVDPRRVSTTIATNTIKLVDKNNVISALVKDTGENLIGVAIDVWTGRSNISQSFADYLQLPTTRIKSISKADNVYTLTTSEESDRMNRPIYDAITRLNGDIFSNTSSFTVKDSIADFPASGFLHVDNEFMSYSSKNDGTKTFLGVTRGEFNTTPSEHSDNADIELADYLTGNPLDIILKLLISGGGGGAYDTLSDGLGITNTLIDIDEIEDLRDNLFDDVEFGLAFYGITNALKFIEKELLEPNNLRFAYSRNSKLTLVVLNKAQFVPHADIIDEDSLSKSPQTIINDNKIVNQIQVDWDYDEDTGQFQNRSAYTDDDSISAYGLKTPLNFQFKGIKEDLAGQDLVDAFANALLSRLSFPTPEISCTTHIAKSLLNIGDKTRLETSQIPNSTGRLNYAEELEVISRAINYQTAEVTLKLAYTSFTGTRSCYIAPSDTLFSITSQSIVNFASGRGTLWREGWKVRLWNNNTMAYESDAVNTISSISGDVITFEDAWATVLATHHRIKFADYGKAVSDEKRYGFIDINNSDFPDGGKQYKVLP